MKIRTLFKTLFLTFAGFASIVPLHARVNNSQENQANPNQGSTKPAWRFERGTEEHSLMMLLSKLARSAKDEVLPPLKSALEAASKARAALDAFEQSKGTEADRKKLLPVGNELEATLNEMIPLLRMAGSFVKASVERSQRFESLKSRLKSEDVKEILEAAEAANNERLHQYRQDYKRLAELLYVICALQESLVNNAPLGLKKAAHADFGADKYNELFALA